MINKSKNMYKNKLIEFENSSKTRLFCKLRQNII